MNKVIKPLIVPPPEFFSPGHADCPHACNNCDWVGKADDCECDGEIPHIWERVSAGEPYPSGECPVCGALTTPMTPVNQLIAKYGDDNGWGEHPKFPRCDWRSEAENYDTQLGYWEWVWHKVEDAAEETRLDDSMPADPAP